MNLMIVVNQTTYIDWKVFHKHEEDIIILRKGKPFSVDGIEVSADHTKVTVDPSKSLDRVMSVWTDCGNNRSLCQGPKVKTELDLGLVQMIAARKPDGQFVHYSFKKPTFSDFIRTFLFKLGVYLKPPK